MENKNTVVALVLMLVVWVAFSFLFPPAPQAPPSGTPETEKNPVQTSSSASADESSKSGPSSPAPLSQQPLLTSEDLRDLTVENEVFRAVLTNSGGRISFFELKNFKQTPSSGSDNVTLVDVKAPKLASLATSGTDGLFFDSNTIYAISVDQDQVRISGTDSHRITFTAPLPGGLVVEKHYTFYGDRYDFDLEVKVTNSGTSSARGNIHVGLVHFLDPSVEEEQFEHRGPTTLAGEELHKEKPSDLAKEGPKQYGKDTVWSSFETKYFMTAGVPLKGAAEQTVIENVDSTVRNIFQSPFQTIEPGETASLSFLFYFGPRDLDILKQVDHQLARAIDFGFFSILARPLLYVLKFFYGFFGNYGVSIILLTIIIKLLFWPLTQKSYTSMKAMQTLQPQMQKLREKYKNDKQRLNTELMQLYKKNRVNPLGGCLPMVIQIPVFFALYKVLLDTIELRHAPFIFWLTDLSAKDPYYITPVIMGATMFIQQKMTPTTMDPTQAKIFTFMPVVFTFMFLNFPSGLVIYWLVNNLLTILQQYFVKRQA